MPLASMFPVDEPFGPDWIRAYFTEVDRMDPDGLLAWYAPDGAFRFGNAPPATGKDAIRRTLQAFYGGIQAMRHEEQGVWADAESGVFEAHVHFTRPDGEVVVIPAASVLRLRDGRVADFRMIMDAAPLGAGGGEG